MVDTGPRVAVAVGDAHELEWLRSALGDAFVVSWLGDSSAVLQGVDDGTIEVLIIGDQLTDVSGAALIEQIRERVGSGSGRLVCLRATNAPDDDNADLASDAEEMVFYVLHGALSTSDVQALVQSAVARRRATVSGPVLHSAVEAERVQRVLTAAQSLASQRDLVSAERVAIESTLRLLDADRAYCLFHDSETGALWSEDDSDGIEDGTAAIGLTGFAARTGTVVWATRVGKDPRYVSAIDDPVGTGDEQLLAQPVLGAADQVQAVLVAVRKAGQPPFSSEEKLLLATFAEHASPTMQHLALQVDVESFFEEQASDGWGLPSEASVFRQEAFAAHVDREVVGDVVRVSPSWVHATYWVLLAILAVGILYIALGSINQYSAGPAIVRMGGRTEVTARAPGTLVALDVVPGQRVAQGQVLGRFYNADQLAAYKQVQREWEAQLRNYLLDRADPSTSAAVGQVRARMQLAHARLEERTVRAAHAGIVSDLRARPGQHLMAGNSILSLVDDETHLTVIAVLPGGDRPQLLAGMELRLELAGYRYAYQVLEIESVADQVIGPEEARRYLGAQIGDSIPIRGPVVLVTAKLPAATFEADGDTYHYYDGMPGLAEVRIRSESILMTLVPALKKL